MKKVLLFCVLVYYCISSYSQMPHSGNVSGTWYKADNPHTVNGNIVIPDGSTLTIEPGVIVEFEHNSTPNAIPNPALFYLDVKGRLIADGDDIDSITFRTVSPSLGDRWGGIVFDGTLSSNNSLIDHCIFEYGEKIDNGSCAKYADECGGAIYIKDFSNVVISNCEFRNNESARGGAIFICNYDTNRTTEPNIISNEFHHNSATGGGAIVCYGEGSNPAINSNNIHHNYFHAVGGGIFVDAFASPTIKGNIITQNKKSSTDPPSITPPHGGGGICCCRSSPIIINNSISFNNGKLHGGGILIRYGGAPIISNNDINNNKVDHESGTKGGGIYCTGMSTINLTNNLIVKNKAINGDGGGIYLESSWSDSININNNTISNNKATGIGGGVYYDDQGSNPVFTNTIIWGNIPITDQVFPDPNDITVLCNHYYYCDIANITLNPPLPNNNISIDPKFDSQIGKYSLQNCSPCIDHGDSNVTHTSVDLDGNNRIINDTIDIGAYETPLGIPAYAELVILDSKLDVGNEDNEESLVLLGSQDIWNRLLDPITDPNYEEAHQNPKYKANPPWTNYLCVRVRNIGCAISEPADLRLYWTRARDYEEWPDHWLHPDDNDQAPYNTPYPWVDNKTINGDPFGAEITKTSNFDRDFITITPLAPGETKVFHQPWLPPNPENFDVISPWEGTDAKRSLCFLARIESQEDPMTWETQSPIELYVKKNNNAATRNAWIFITRGGDGSSGLISEFVTAMIYNPSQDAVHTSIKLYTHRQPQNEIFLDYGNIGIYLDDNLWSLWEENGFSGAGYQIVGDKILITDINSFSLDSIAIESDSLYEIGIQFELNDSTNEDTLEFSYLLYTSNSTNSFQEILFCNVNTLMFEETEGEEPPSEPERSSFEYEEDDFFNAILNIYPNPANNKFTIYYQIAEEHNNSAISIYDMLGKQVYSQVIIKNIGKIKIDKDDIGYSGIFNCVLQSNGKVIKNKRIVINE